MENAPESDTAESPSRASQKREEPEDSGDEAVPVKLDAKQRKKERLLELKVLPHYLYFYFL